MFLIVFAALLQSFIQDESLLSPELAAVMARVRQGADVMPRAQLEAAMAGELGADWRTARFAEFEDAPIAAASIGQVRIANFRNNIAQL